MAIDDTPFFQIVGGHLNSDFVACRDLDEKLTHLSRDVRKNNVSVFEFDSIHRSREYFNYRSDNFY